MSKVNVRVDLPIKNPVKIITLCEAILARHSALGPASPLLDPLINMLLFISMFDTFKTKHAEAGVKDGLAQATTQEADIALGIDEGQDSKTEGTIYYIMTAIIARLLLFYKNKEEQISTFGLNVVMDTVRGRVTVRVDLPIREREKMINLVDSVLQRHNLLGPASPLNVPETNIPALLVLQATHKNKRTEAKLLDEESQALMQEARYALGTDEGQSIRTENTVYYLITSIRDKLLAVHRNHEEQLSTYGFNVVISTTPLPGYGTPETHTGAVNPSDTLGIVDGMTDGTNLILKNKGTVDLIFCRGEEGVPCDPVIGTTVNPGGDASVTGADIGTGAWLNVTNNDPANAGAFEVEVS